MTNNTVNPKDLDPITEKQGWRLHFISQELLPHRWPHIPVSLVNLQDRLVTLKYKLPATKIIETYDRLTAGGARQEDIQTFNHHVEMLIKSWGHLGVEICDKEQIAKRQKIRQEFAAKK